MSETVKPRTPRSVRRSENTSKIIEAAIRCLNAHGASDTTLMLIAQTAGVSRGQVQNIFGLRRSDLLLRIADEIFNRYVEQYMNAADRAASAEEFVTEMWGAIRKLYAKPETLALIEIWLSTRTDKAFNKMLRAKLSDTDARLNERWTEVFAKDGVDPAAVQIIRYLQRSVMRGLAIERLMDAKEDVFHQVIDAACGSTLSIVAAHKASTRS